MNASMRTRYLTALGVFAMGWCGSAAAQKAPQVFLSVPSDQALAKRGVITFSISNPTSERIAIVSFDTPFATDGDRLANVEFEVLNPSNQSLPYQGRNVYFGPPDASSFVTLEPHQTLTKNVDVAKEYGLTEGGSYKITYVKSIRVLHAADSRKISSLNAGDEVPSEVSRSNTLTFYVDGALLKSRRDAVHKRAAVPGAAASTSRKKPMIYSSEKRFFTSNLLLVKDWTRNRAATQIRGGVDRNMTEPDRRVREDSHVSSRTSSKTRIPTEQWKVSQGYGEIPATP